MADEVHGRFGGSVHYRLIQATLHRLVDRYYEKNSRILVENDEIELQSHLAQRLGRIGAGRDVRARKTMHPDVAFYNEPGEAGMESEKTIIVECETRKHGLLADTLRVASYQLLREKNPDRNELMIYLAFPADLRGDVDKPDWANDLWWFDVGDDAEPSHYLEVREVDRGATAGEEQLLEMLEQCPECGGEVTLGTVRMGPFGVWEHINPDGHAQAGHHTMLPGWLDEDDAQEAGADD